MEFFEAKGYNTIGLLARSSPNDTEFVNRFEKPFCDGVKTDGKDFKTTADADITEARFLVFFDDAKSLRKAELATTAAPPPTSTSARSPGPGTVIIDPATYQAQIDKWQDHWTPSITSPQIIIQGADYVLQRLPDEINTTRFYTPLHLSEVVQPRAHCTDGSMNLSRVERPRRDKRIYVTGSGVKVEKATPDPLADANRWLTFDALAANAWAL